MVFRILVIIIISCILMSIGINLPFVRHNESSCTQVGKLSRNFLKFGLDKTRGIPLDVSGHDLGNYPDCNKYHYSSHPPGTYYVAALFQSVFGSNEIAIRLIAVLSAAICIYLFYLCVGLIDSKLQIIASILFSFSAMFVYNSVSVVHLVVVQVFIFASLYHYLKGNMRASLIFQVIACYFDWQGYYLAIVYLVHSFFVKKKVYLMPVIFNFAVFAVYLLHLYLVDPAGSALGWLFKLGAERSSFNFPFLFRYLMSEGREVLIYFSVVTVALSVVWIIRLFKGITERDTLILSFAFLALDEILFSWYASHHDYFTYFLGPFFAISAACVLSSVLVKSRIAFGILIVLALAQNLYFIKDRLTRQGAYEFYYQMASSINKVSNNKHDKILVLVHTLHFYTPFYSDRYYVTFDWKEKHLVRENTDSFMKKDVNLIKFIKENKDGFKYVVLTTKKALRENTSYFKNIGDEDESFTCTHIVTGIGRDNCFHIHNENSDIYRFLASNYRKIEQGAFIFFCLDSSPSSETYWTGTRG